MLANIIKSLGLSLIGMLIGYLVGHHDGSLSANLKASKSLVVERDYAISKLKDAIQAKQEVEVQYEAAKKSKLDADAGARAELERLRKSIASANKAATSGSGADGERGVWPELFEQSTSRYFEVASEAGRLSDKVNALQNYVANVCLAND